VIVYENVAFFSTKNCRITAQLNGFTCAIARYGVQDGPYFTFFLGWI
jgi:hypothetical protein